VTYNRKGEVLDCLFCRIVHGHESNSLWYKDDFVSAFVPRDPSARIHLLIVPNAHVKNTASLTLENLPLLNHMKGVASELLNEHAPFFAFRTGKLPARAHPPPYSFTRGGAMEAMINKVRMEADDCAARALKTPSSSSSRYLPHHLPDYMRYQHQPLPDDVSDFTHRRGVWSELPPAAKLPSPSSSPSSPLEPSKYKLCYHRAGYNSVDHLHLHALLLPFKSVGDSLHFLTGSPWTYLHDDLVKDLQTSAKSGAYALPPATSSPASVSTPSADSSETPVPAAGGAGAVAIKEEVFKPQASEGAVVRGGFVVDAAVLARAAKDVEPDDWEAKAALAKARAAGMADAAAWMSGLSTEKAPATPASSTPTADTASEPLT
jgi:Scavenger mRNA decapping enzyme C-term binding